MATITDEQRWEALKSNWGPAVSGFLSSLGGGVPPVFGPAVANVRPVSATPAPVVPPPAPKPAAAPQAAMPTAPVPMASGKGISQAQADVMINGVPPGTKVPTPDDLAKQLAGAKFAPGTPATTAGAAPVFDPNVMRSVFSAMSDWTRQQQGTLRNPQQDVLEAARESRAYNANLLAKAIDDVKFSGWSVSGMMHPDREANRISQLYSAALGGTMDQKTPGEIGQAGTGFNTALSGTSSNFLDEIKFVIVYHFVGT